jgi:hypothetical protein
MGAGTDETAREERDAEPPSSEDPASEASYEDGWYRSLAAWGRVGARGDSPRGASEDADLTGDADPAARDAGGTDTAVAEDDEESASP